MTTSLIHIGIKWSDIPIGEWSQYRIIGITENESDNKHLISYSDGQCDTNYPKINRNGYARCPMGAHYRDKDGLVYCGNHWNHEINRHHKPL